ncbi:hypothetical protein [Flavobacterium sp. J27]|uniref:hypothetical protein n=1 Tax=Flavobacterium sp. J27 TaxID=2060419 RepID=UPI00102FC2DA|nr:hypothetical protein [Flavobacterium sp. J27]
MKENKKKFFFSKEEVGNCKEQLGKTQMSKILGGLVDLEIDDPSYSKIKPEYTRTTYTESTYVRK